MPPKQPPSRTLARSGSDLSLVSVGPFHVGNEAAAGCTTNVVKRTLHTSETLLNVAPETPRGGWPLALPSPKIANVRSSAKDYVKRFSAFLRKAGFRSLPGSSKRHGDSAESVEQSQPRSRNKEKRSRYSSTAEYLSQQERKEQKKSLKNNFTWMFVFPLPSTVGAREQRRFERILRRSGNSAEGLLHKAFGTFMEKHSIDMAMAMDAPGCESPEVSRSRDLESPLLASEPTSYSNARALQCGIEMTLSFFHSFDVSCKQYFTKRGDKKTAEIISPSDSCVEVLKFTSNCKTHLYTCVRMKCAVAELLADISEYPVQLDKEKLEPRLGIKLSDKDSQPAYTNYRKAIRDLCRLHKDAYEPKKWSVLRQMDRIRIFYDRVSDSINVNELLRSGLLLHSMPLHHEETLRSLRKHWCGNKTNLWLLCSLHQPLDDIRAYFGEEVAFHFAFLHMLARASLVLAIVGIFFFVISFHYGKACKLGFGLFMMGWYRVFVKCWQQREAEYANQWGVDTDTSSTIKKRDNIRFYGQLMASPENERFESEQVSKHRRVRGRVISLLLSLLFIVCLLCVLLFEHYVYFLSLSRSSFEDVHELSIVFGCLAGAQVKVLDTIWDNVSAWITDWEFWRQEDDFDESMRQKTVVVKFVSSIFSVALLAFVLPLVAQNVPISFVQAQLVRQLTCIIVTRYLLINDFVDGLLKPYHKLQRKQRAHAQENHAKHAKSLSAAERQVDMATYTANELTNDYLDIIIPLALTILFGTVNPLAPVLLFLCLQVNVRVDAWKLVNIYRRPFPRMVKDIGVMNSMLDFIAHAMIATNLGLVLVELGGIVQWLPIRHYVSSQGKLLEFLAQGFCFLSLWLLFFIFWHVLEFLVPGVSYHVTLERKRQDLQRHVLSYKGFPDGSASLLSTRLVSMSSSPSERPTRERKDFRTVPPISGARRGGRSSNPPMLRHVSEGPPISHLVSAESASQGASACSSGIQGAT